jgi:hypothetical protein
MKKVTVEVDEKFGRILTVTAIGSDGHDLHSTVTAIDLSKNNRIEIDSNGEPHTFFSPMEGSVPDD